MYKTDYKSQFSEWKKKSWSIPDLRGGKQLWIQLVFGLIEYIGQNESCSITDYPEIPDVSNVQTMREYFPFLKGIGLVRKQSNTLVLTKEGCKFRNHMSKEELAELIQNKYRLFGEILYLLTEEELTISEINNEICSKYNLRWANLSNTRKRTDWLEVLELIEPLANKKWKASSLGEEKIKKWHLVSPDAIEQMESESLSDIEIQEPPEEIATLLQRLYDSPELHKKRSTYNICVPSPNNDKIDSLRTIIEYVCERTSKKELFRYICEEFSLKTSSVESMLPFLKASGLIEEVGRNVFIATPAAKAWLETGNDLDYIRILHSNMRFVGEIIKETENIITRSEIYDKAKEYGLNSEKTRWRLNFLIEAGVVEEPQYLHLKATPLGKAFVKELPLADPEQKAEAVQIDTEQSNKIQQDHYDKKLEKTIDLLTKAAVDPLAENKASGVAFEEEIANMFCLMGFDAKRIGGSGDTDVIVRWKDDEGKNHIAIVDGKSKSNGQVSHSDISDVAIDTHKEKNNAEYVAIIGNDFSGNTIKNHARKKSFALITANELSEIARASHTLGLSLQEMSLLFQVPNGMSMLNEIIAEKQRELDIIAVVVSTMYSEQDEEGDLSPRDLHFVLKKHTLSPSQEELITAFTTLSKPEIGVLKVSKKNSDPEHVFYTLSDSRKSICRLRAIASAIESGVSE